jgi:NADH:ubiquinone oxidoreductase subunit E
MKGSVLVVDDEKVILTSCERILGPAGYEVHTLQSAEGALELMKKEPFDLVITDMRMPGMDGMEFMRRVRAGDNDVHIILITGYPSQESLMEALSLGIVDYLPKPFSPALLLEAAEKAMELSKKAAAASQPEVQGYTEQIAAGLDGIIAKYKNKPGSLIPVLQAAQELVGYLPPVVLRHIARGLNVPVSEVHGVVSFYSFFTMKPKGKHNIRVCLGTACYVKRAEEIMEKLKKRLNIDIGEVTPDRKFSLESVRCLGACGLAPVVVVDKDTHGSVNPVKAPDILMHYED